jgi:hypothetical protein
MGHSTLWEQEKQLKGGLHIVLVRKPGDLRKERGSRAPDGRALLSEYESTVAKLKPILGSRLKKMERDSRVKTFKQKLRQEFPELAERESALDSAAGHTPSKAAFVILGQRYALAPSRIDKLLRKARREAAVIHSGLAGLQERLHRT